MITLTHLPNEEQIHVAPSAILVASTHPNGGSFLLLAFGPATQVRETPDEVRAMVEAALRPTEAADVAAARQAARLLHRVADVVRDDKVAGFSSGDIGEAMDSCLGIRSATWRETADELDRLADRLAAP